MNTQDRINHALDLITACQEPVDTLMNQWLVRLHQYVAFLPPLMQYNTDMEDSGSLYLPTDLDLISTSLDRDDFPLGIESDMHTENSILMALGGAQWFNHFDFAYVNESSKADMMLYDGRSMAALTRRLVKRLSEVKEEPLHIRSVTFLGPRFSCDENNEALHFTKTNSWWSGKGEQEDTQACLVLPADKIRRTAESTEGLFFSKLVNEPLKLRLTIKMIFRVLYDAWLDSRSTIGECMEVDMPVTSLLKEMSRDEITEIGGYAMYLLTAFVQWNDRLKGLEETSRLMHISYGSNNDLLPGISQLSDIVTKKGDSLVPAEGIFMNPDIDDYVRDAFLNGGGLEEAERRGIKIRKSAVPFRSRFTGSETYRDAPEEVERKPTAQEKHEAWFRDFTKRIKC